MIQKLWQPSFAQPKMTMEEHGEKEYELMMAKQEKNKFMAEAETEAYLRQGIKDINDEDNPIVSEMKTYKARAWDIFKDENEKGAGNKNHN